MNTAQQKLLSMFLDLATYEVGHMSDGLLITDEFHRQVARHPIVARALILATGAIITLHLADVLDGRYDLLARKFWRLRCRRVVEHQRSDSAGTVRDVHRAQEEG
ncbi:hypothetical protein [Mycobacterium canetti]|uniref:DUF7427 family protein n=1 Tax=Mycobacterium canetti TaxID=78331 RepID=UPI001E353D14|nr:hypothetical protein [Mycobacterium canetti]